VLDDEASPRFGTMPLGPATAVPQLPLLLVVAINVTVVISHWACARPMGVRHGLRFSVLRAGCSQQL